jgi:Helix-turn-helix domain
MSGQQSEKSLSIERPGNSAGKLLADFLTQGEAAAELRVCERTLDRWRTLGEGPPITKIGRRVYYRRSTLREWLCARERGRVT